MRPQPLMCVTRRRGRLEEPGVRNPFVAVALLMAALGVSAAAPQDRARTVWADPGDGATVSPTGQMVAFVDWSSGDIAVRDLAAGTTTRLTDKGIFAGGGGFPEPALVFSPDGDRLVYPYGNPLAGEPFAYELRLTGVRTPDQHILATYAPDIEWVAPLDWHAESGILLTTVAGDGRSDLLVMQPPDRRVRILERRPPMSGIIRQAHFTADGRAVAYLTDGHVRLISVRGGPSREVGLEAEALLGWSGDGRRLLFHAARRGVVGIWAIAMSTGRVIGEPTLQLPTAAGVLPARRNAGGVHFLEPSALSRLFVVTLDLEGGRVAAAPQPVPWRVDGVPGNPAWSRDGKRIAFTVHHPNRTLHRVMVSEGIHGPPREIARVDMRVTGLDWSSDGKFLVVGGRGDIRPSSWVGRIDAVTGAIERLASVPVNALASGANADVAYVRAAPAGERTVRLSLIPGSGGPARVLASYVASELPRTMSVSPDGRWIALVKSIDERRASALLLVPVPGGEARTVLRLERPDAIDLNAGGLPWTPDGRRVLAVVRRQGTRHLATVDIETGALTLFAFAPQQTGRRQPALHPDGRQLLYVDGEERAQLKVMPERGRSRVSGRVGRLRGGL